MDIQHVLKFSNQVPKTWTLKCGKQLWFSCNKAAVSSHFPMLNHFSPCPGVLGRVWLKPRTPTGHKHPVTRGSKGTHRNAFGFLRQLSAPLLTPPVFLPAAAVTQKSAGKLTEAVEVLLKLSRKHMQEIPGTPCTSRQWQGIRAGLSKAPHQKKASPHPSSCCAPAVSAPALAGDTEMEYSREQNWDLSSSGKAWQ